MIQIVVAVLSTFILTAPGLSRTPPKPADADPPALRLMNNTQFSLFLEALNADVLRWKAQLKTVDVAALGLEPQDARELASSYHLCFEALDNIRADTEKLSQKQTLKLDLLLLIDLNGLARDFDRLSSNLASPITPQRPSSAQKSLDWARSVLRIDQALAARIAEFQQHVLALAGLMDLTLDQAEDATDPPQPRN